MPRPGVAEVFVRGSTWSEGFKGSLQSAGVGDDAYGYRVDDNGARDVLPWVNLNQVVVRLASPPVIAGLPAPGTVQFQSQRGAAYAVTRVESVAGDPRAFVFVLDRPLGGDGSGAGANGDRLTVTVRGAGPGGADLTVKLNVLQGDVDRSGTVVADDFSAVKKRFFRSAAAPGPAGDTQYTVFHDVDGSGSIVANDFSEVKKRFFDNLPAAPAAAAGLFSDSSITKEVLA